ncbi:WapI family immunity protein [Candidatus Pristimantibacillus sp. PTI5]|uniref:WapI family immunity protein n=1 Tax=Candidatus Pristimantibacillus sp. PTI5 TaxID=3400422 RepID=UPI003B011D07
MKIESMNRRSGIAFELVETHQAPLPSLCFSITISDNEYSGANPQVWVEARDLHAFISAVKKINLERQGSATLEGMSPQEFQLTLQSVNRKGDFVLDYSLSKHVYLDYSSTKRAVSGAFDINPSDLERIAKSFSALVSI